MIIHQHKRPALLSSTARKTPMASKEQENTLCRWLTALRIIYYYTCLGFQLFPFCYFKPFAPNLHRSLPASTQFDANKSPGIVLFWWVFPPPPFLLRMPETLKDSQDPACLDRGKDLLFNSFASLGCWGERGKHQSKRATRFFKNSLSLH